MPDDTPNPVRQALIWLRVTARWVKHNLGNPEIAAILRQELDLKDSEEIEDYCKDVRRTFEGLSGVDLHPDVDDLAVVTLEIRDIIAALKKLAKPGQNGWDVAFRIGCVALADLLRLDAPGVHAAAKLAMLIEDNIEVPEKIDLEPVLKIFAGELPPDIGNRFFTVLSNNLYLLAVMIDAGLKHAEAPVKFDYFHGWDPAPETDTEIADIAAQRTLTMLISNPDAPADTVRAGLSLAGVPEKHGGPGLIASIGGDYQDNIPISDGIADVSIQIGVPNIFNVFLPFGGQPFQRGGALDGFAKVEVTAKGKNNKPAFVFGEPAGTRLQIGKANVGGELARDRGAVTFGLTDGKLIITPGAGDAFLRQIISDDIEIDFKFKAKLDSQKGLVIDGGTGLKATIPVEKTVLDVLTVHYITVGLEPSATPGRIVKLEVSGAFGVKLGPFQASVERLGFLFDAGLGEGDLGFLDAGIGFKPPNGLGLLMDAGIIKGGGYLAIDHARGEYAGALELKLDLPIAKFGIKAIGVLTTKLPDGGDGWALLLMVYGEFPPIQLSWGFTLNGVGGMIGLQHGVSTVALIAGLQSGALDDVMFPENPVADAPRIINRLRTVFPITRRALTIGLFVEAGWGTPNLVTIRAGVIVQLDNVLGPGSGRLAFGRLLLLGQLLIKLPPGVPDELTVLKILVDFVGYVETNPLRIGFVAQLRDSYAGVAPLKVDFGGTLVVQAVFGERPSFVLAAGGFHPQFTDLPPGLPSPINRLSAAFPIKIIKVRVEAYFAVTPASIQAGALVQIKAEIGRVSLEAHIGFDAIVYLVPVTRFDVKIYGSAKVKYRGHTLGGIGFEFRLEGPGRWRARGFGKFSVLFWDVEVPFDESWGQNSEAPAVLENAAARLRAQLADINNWSAQLPLGSEPLVNLATITGGTSLLAHPLGTLQFTQRLLPFDLDLQKLGTAGISGAKKFTIQDCYIGLPTQTNTGRQLLQQHFAVGEFRTLSDADRLTKPGFQAFNAGAKFGSDKYVASNVPNEKTSRAAPDQGMEYETLYLEPEPETINPFNRFSRNGERSVALPMAAAKRLARQGGAAKSQLRTSERLKPANPANITVSDARLAIASVDTMAVGAVRLTGAQVTSPALAETAIGDSPAIQLVEAFELA